jgi:glucose-6-phosphate isomerase
MAGEVSVARTLSGLAAEGVIERIWQRDHTVWSPHPDGISDRLGWLDAADWVGPLLGEIRAFADATISEGIEHFALLGMGGSSRAAKVIHRTFSNAPGHPVMVPGESTVPATIGSAMRRIDASKTLVLISSKSGTTMEPLLTYRVFRDAIKRSIGPEAAGRRFAAITDPGTPLADLAAETGFGKVFLNDPEVGGRFSAITYFGLVPAALLGADIGALVGGGRRMRELCGPGLPPDTNPAAVLGATIGSMAVRGRDKLTLVTSPAMFGYGLWVVQLVAESLGKDGKGVVPVAGEPLVEAGLYARDRLFVYLRLDGDDNDETDDKLEAVSALGHPVITLRMPNREALGGEFFRWELAVAVAAHVMGVNPFDQPDVQLSKDRTREILTNISHGASVKAPGETGLSAGDGAGQLAGLLAGAGDGDYLGVLAFLPHTQGIDDALRRLREAVLRRYRLATTLGHGPGYLHSTGQLHKGGPDSGIFLLLTAPHTADITIPGHTYSLGDVTDADALGDLGALSDLDRRVVHVALSDDSADSIDALTSALS